MKCPTCGQETTVGGQYCARCGWPAGRLTAEPPREALDVGSSAPASVPVLIKNVGAGPVEYTVRICDDQPWAFISTPELERAAETETRHLAAGDEDNSLSVGVDGDEFDDDAENIVVEIVSSDRNGVGRNDFRPWSVASHRWRTWQVYVPARALGPPEIHIGQKLVIFTPHQRKHTVRIENKGGTEAGVSATDIPPHINASWQWFEQADDNTQESQDAGEDDEELLVISFDDDDNDDTGADEGGVDGRRAGEQQDETRRVTEPIYRPQSVGGRSMIELVVEADAEFEGTASLTVQTPDGDYEILLWGQPPPRSAGIVQRWTVGIDFGTAKSAVYYTDNRVEVQERQPHPIRWPAGPRESKPTETTTRSAMMFRAKDDVPLCGHNVVVSVGAEGPDELVIESMKTRLRTDREDARIQLPGGQMRTPTELVSEFLDYILRHIRSSEPFRGEMDIDAEFVLSLPIIGDTELRRKQRDRTQRAAERAGLPVNEALMMPAEPECAALDLMHSLRQGRYQFGGKDYQLQDGEILLVFDCGAGTTDVAILRVALSGNEFGLQQLGTVGYRFGGNTIDDMLLSWLLDQRMDRYDIQYRDDRLVLQLPDLQQPVPIDAAREECRRIKESLFTKGGGEGEREFHTDLGHFQLSQDDVHRLITPFLDAFYTGGVMPEPSALFGALADRLDDDMRRAIWREMHATAGESVTTLRDTLDGAGLRKRDVTFIFVTGGTSQIPIVASRLHDFLGRAARIVKATAEDCTVNVARGAALHYDYRLQGMLPCVVDIVAREADTGRELLRDQALHKGGLPGLQYERTIRIGARQSLQIVLEATCGTEGVQGPIASEPVRNEAPSQQQMTIQIEYSGDHVLWWKAEFADGQVVIPTTEVLRA